MASHLSLAATRKVGVIGGAAQVGKESAKIKDDEKRERRQERGAQVAAERCRDLCRAHAAPFAPRSESRQERMRSPSALLRSAVNRYSCSSGATESRRYWSRGATGAVATRLVAARLIVSRNNNGCRCQLVLQSVCECECASG